MWVCVEEVVAVVSLVAVVVFSSTEDQVLSTLSWTGSKKGKAGAGEGEGGWGVLRFTTQTSSVHFSIHFLLPLSLCVLSLFLCFTCFALLLLLVRR